MSKIKPHSPKAKAVVTCSAQLVELGGQAPSEIRLLPDGKFRAKDGRPAELSCWVMNNQCAVAILSAAGKQADAYVIDYDHQTLNARANGQPAPAAGWYRNLEWRPGDGLFATDVEWTAAAKQMIENKEYRYISPVMAYDRQSGEIIAVTMAALVNHPALDGLNDLAAAHFDYLLNDETTTMDKDDLIAALCYLLNLPVTSTPTEISNELDKVKAIITGSDGKTEGLAAYLAKQHTALAANPDPAKYVPLSVVHELQTQFAALSAKLQGNELEKLIAINEAKLPTPGLKEWAKTLSMDALSAYLQNAVPVAALGGMQSGGKEPGGGETAALSVEEKAICKRMGQSEKDYLAYKQQLAEGAS